MKVELSFAELLHLTRLLNEERGFLKQYVKDKDVINTNNKLHKKLLKAMVGEYKNERKRA